VDLSLPCVAIRCSVLQCVAASGKVSKWMSGCHNNKYSVLQRVAVCCSVVHCVAVCCSVWQYMAVVAVVAVRGSVRQGLQMSVCLQ